MKYEMRAKTPLNPTEDIDKVIKSFSNIFDYDQIEIGDNYILVSGGKDSLLRLKEKIEKRRIRNTAHHILNREAIEGYISFKLNKQAAFSGVVNFTEDNLSPLGEINVKIETPDVEKFIDWLAPLQE